MQRGQYRPAVSKRNFWTPHFKPMSLHYSGEVAAKLNKLHYEGFLDERNTRLVYPDGRSNKSLAHELFSEDLPDYLREAMIYSESNPLAVIYEKPEHKNIFLDFVLLSLDKGSYRCIGLPSITLKSTGPLNGSIDFVATDVATNQMKRYSGHY
jgi:hypothetical protein